MSPIGTYDPDEEESAQVKVHGWQKPKTKLEEDALRATNPKTMLFHDRTLARLFRKQTVFAIGRDEESILWEEWIRHNIEWVIEKNKIRPILGMAMLVKMIGNDARRENWFTTNRERILRKRQVEVKGIFYKE